MPGDGQAWIYNSPPRTVGLDNACTANAMQCATHLVWQVKERLYIKGTQLKHSETAFWKLLPVWEIIGFEWQDWINRRARGRGMEKFRVGLVCLFIPCLISTVSITQGNLSYNRLFSAACSLGRVANGMGFFLLVWLLSREEKERSTLIWKEKFSFVGSWQDSLVWKVILLRGETFNHPFL